MGVSVFGLIYFEIFIWEKEEDRGKCWGCERVKIEIKKEKKEKLTMMMMMVDQHDGDDEEGYYIMIRRE